MEDITWKEILFIIIIMIVGGYMSYNYAENYREVVTAAKVINSQNQNKQDGNMLIRTRYNETIISEHIESFKRPYGLFPYYQVVMKSGAKHVVHPDELRKAFPDL